MLMARKSLLAKSSILNFIGQLLPMVIAVATVPSIVRGLGDGGYGILSIAFMVLGYFSIFDLGLSRATVKFVAEHMAPSLVHQVPAIVWTSLALLVLFGTAGGALAAAFVPLAVTHLFKMSPTFVPQARTALFVLCASMPVILGNDALRGVLEGAQRFDLINYVKIPSSTCFYLFAAAAVALGFKVPGVVFILVLVRFATAFAYLFCCFHAIPSLRSNFRLSRSAIRPLASYGGWIMVSNITGPVFGNIERFLIASFLSVNLLTYYSVPFDLVGKILIFPSSLAPALFPYFSYHGDRSREQVADVSARSLKYLLLVMVPATAVFAFFAREILQLWLGSAFATQSATVMKIVAILFFFNAIAYIPYSSVQALGKPELKAALDVFSLPVYAVLSISMMKGTGINGAAAAKLIITVADCVLLYGFACKIKAFQVSALFSGALLKTIVASVVFCCFVGLVHLLHTPLAISGLLLCLGVCGFIGAFYAFAVDPEERSALRTIPATLLLWRRAA